MEAARAAGMVVAAVPANIQLKFRPLFEGVDFLFEQGMEEFRAERLISLLEERLLL